MSEIVKSDQDILALVIEDNEGDYILIEDFLLEKFKTIKIEHCRNYEDSISLIENHKSALSIILLDLHLPDLNGIDLIKQILDFAAQVPVIILTGYADVYLAQKSLQIGVYDFLIKDELNPNLLQKSVEFAINRRYFISQIETERSNYENLFDLSPQPIWLVDEENLQILNANFSAINKYGYSLVEFKGMSFLGLHPENEHDNMIERLKGEINKTDKQRFTHTLKNKEEIKVDVYFERLSGQLDEKRIIIQSNDVTETLNYIDTIEIQNNKLREIAWTQSHVVRAPLSRILGIIGLIENNRDSIDDLEFWLDQLKVSSQEMDDIVQKIVREAKQIDFKK